MNNPRISEMSERLWNVYLSGEIHSDWREQIATGVAEAGLPVHLDAPITVHEDSDDCAAVILGEEESPFWRDQKSSRMNAIRTRTLIGEADIVVVRFGDKYKQWNAAFDAGTAAALGTALINPARSGADPCAEGGGRRRPGGLRDATAGGADPCLRHPRRAARPQLQPGGGVGASATQPLPCVSSRRPRRRAGAGRLSVSHSRRWR